VAGREGKRGECQTGLGLVWRETGAVRSARPSRSKAASTPEEGVVEGRLRSHRVLWVVCPHGFKLLNVKENVHTCVFVQTFI